MIKNEEWSTIQAVAEALKTQGYKDDQAIHINFLIRGRKSPDTRKILFSDFLTIMWRLFDHKLEMDYVVVELPDGQTVFKTALAEQKTRVADDKPTSGNGDLVRYWKNRSPKERDAHLKVLWSQIASTLFPIRNGKD